MGKMFNKKKLVPRQAIDINNEYSRMVAKLGENTYKLTVVLVEENKQLSKRIHELTIESRDRQLLDAANSKKEGAHEPV